MAEKKSGTSAGAGVPGGRSDATAKRAGGAGAKKASPRAAGAPNGPQGGTATGTTAKKAAGATKSAGTGAARTSAAKTSATKTPAAKTPAAKTGGAARGKAPDLRKDLRDFASARPEGWSHDDWLTFLEHLKSRGHNITEREEIGRALEKERLDLALEGVQGLQPKGRKSLVERFGNVWSLRDADPDEVSRRGGVDRSVADRIREHLR